MNLFKKTPLMHLINSMRMLEEGDFFIELISDRQTQKFIVKLNTDQLRYEYINADGIALSDIGGGYSDYTLAIGNKTGRFNIDLYDTGEFHDSFRVRSITKDSFEIKSDPLKDDGTNLLDEWGKEIEGLTFKSLEELGDYLLPIYQTKILRKLGV